MTALLCGLAGLAVGAVAGFVYGYDRGWEDSGAEIEGES